MKINFVFGDKFKQKIFEKKYMFIYKKLLSDLGAKIIKPLEHIHVTFTIS